MTPIIVSRVRATLHKQGYQGFSKEQILEAASILNVNSSEPSPEETKAVAKYMVDNLSSNLVKTPIELDSAQLSTLGNHQQVPLAQSPKFEMIRSESQSMGVVLTETDIAQIASNVNSQASETDEMLSEIREAISAYIQYQKQANHSKIQNFLANINHEQNQANQEISQALSDGLQHFAREMEVSRQSFKSSVRTSLKLLALPQD